MRNMAEGGYDPIPPEDGEGKSNPGYDDGYDTPPEEKEEWARYWEEEERKQLGVDKYKPTVSKKTYERWKSEEEEPQKGQEKTQSLYDREDYERWKKEEEEYSKREKVRLIFEEKKEESHGSKVGEMEMKDRNHTKTSTSKVEETSFGGTHFLEVKMQEREMVNEEVLKVFPNFDREYLPLIKFDMYDRLVYKGVKTWKDGVDRNKTYVIAENGMPSNDYFIKSKFPDGLKKALGKSNVEINNENLESQRIEEEHQAKREQELENLKRNSEETKTKLQDGRRNLEKLAEELEECEKISQNYPTIQEAEEVRKRLPRIKEGIRVERMRMQSGQQDLERINQEITKQEEDVNVGQQHVESARERVDERLLSLRDRVKEIFKKHGFTVIAVVSAIGVVIGVIVNSLKAGLARVAKGVGNGLKELGAKLGQILPGMIGAIASFIFKTAGEVIGFLAKNAWLLIVGLVVLAVEQFKKKTK